MERLRCIVRLPTGRGAWHIMLSVVLQGAALLALAIVFRDQRPDPSTDPEGWERMGMLAEFAGIAPAAALFAFLAVTGLFAVFCEPESERSHWCIVILRCLLLGTVLTDSNLVYFAFRTSIWNMFGAVAVVVSLDLALTFLVLRFLETPASLHTHIPGPH